MLSKIVVIFVSSFLLVTQAFAKMSAVGNVLASTEWQKVELEQKLRFQVSDVLKGTLKENQYTVDVKLDVSEPTQPDFMLTPPPPIKEKVRFTVKTADAASADYVVFQKLGLEAPIVSEFKEVKKGKKSEFELLWKYNQSLNLFNNLNSIDIKVSVDDRLSEQTINNVKKALNTTNFNLSRGIQPSITVESVSMVNEFKEKPKMSLLEKLEWFSRFANMIGLITATLLAAIFALILFKKYSDLKKEELAALANQNKTPEKEEKEDKDDPFRASEFPTPESSEEEQIYSGVQRFKTYFEKSPLEASMLLKKWLKTGEELENMALCALVQYLENNDLMSVFSLMSDSDRELWKKVLSKTELKGDLSKISEFIGSQVVDEIIVPQKFVDEELSDLLLSTTEDQAKDFIESDLTYGSMLLNIMNVKFVSKVLENLTQELSNQALSKSFENTDEFLTENIGAFKEKLKGFVVSKNMNPFLDRVMELIPLAKVENEVPLFNSLIEKEFFDELEVAANKFVPAEIISNLSSEVIGELIEYFTMSKKTELIASLEDEEIKQNIISSFAPEGSTAHEMLMLELENYDTDLTLQKHIRENREEIWQNYINHCRKHLGEKAKFDEVRVDLVKHWVAGKKGEEIAIEQESEQAA